MLGLWAVGGSSKGLMMKAKINKYSAIAATVLVTLKSGADSPDPANPAKALPAGTPVAKIILTRKSATENPAVLDARRLFALGQIETGGDDQEIGRSGEVSRYQIMPSVWRHYSDSQSYRDPETSSQVAQQHWTALYKGFKDQAHREPTDFDMYVLWNTSYGYYAKHGFQPEHLGAVVRDRAQRFVNLIQLRAA
jgi:hypothetical protein